ncbi:hypothetical protein F0L68_33130 [Solihabitans fulvus]|uniref:histidine kinase n=1 Tax=Solihabitans fulvus TaxID=1892852 RepID=A0A5B2WQV7_9PSEU|nr:histidine kinase [Solihabitans fulvus]KAA2253358.1 hypothetical protein F0L68_33130 [Solihabitans fulvus]
MRSDGLLAILLGLVLGIPSVVIASLSTLPTTALFLLAGAAIAHVALGWRRARPVVSAAVANGLVFAMALAVPWFVLLPSCLVAPIAIHACTANARVRPALVLAVSVASCLVIGGRYLLWPTGQTPAAAALLTALLVAVVVTAWSLGLLRRTQLAQVELLQGQAREAERARIARDVHDVVAHSLAVIVGLAWADGVLTVSIRDSGPSGPPPAPGGNGIAGMRDRLAILGGTLEAGPLDTGGFRVVATVREPA